MCKLNRIVWIVGASSGQLDLISLKALTLISNCKFCFYVGSLINASLLKLCSSAVCVRSVLEDSVEEVVYMMLCSEGLTVRLQSGSPFVYSGANEAGFYSSLVGLRCVVLPSVGVIDTALAYFGCEFTSVWNKSVVITRLSKKSLVVSKLLSLENVCSFKPLLVLYLSVRLIPFFCKLAAYAYCVDCPVVCVFKSSWHAEAFLLSNLCWLQQDVKRSRAIRMVLIIVGKALLACAHSASKLTR
ncbi:MAG: Cobalt-precorrin-4 C(11)-methyltransferase [Candidatus Hodgkinia cicadicola]|nr:MAG: Cobalt-precorrin-4 C(11)-methyltransferase [Candidatus Hodgkinia cicadicola]